ncbi:MAG: type IV pilus assembly protein PilM [Candidatus Paceibacterales bacterium]
MLDFLTLKPEAFGLDISDLSLKIVKLKKRGKFLALASFGEEEIKPRIIKEGEIKDEKALIEIIKTAIKKVKGEKLKTKYVVASLPEEKAFLQVIQMPRMPEEDLKSAIIYEAENYIPLPIEQVYLDSQVIPPVYDHLDHFDVLIAVLPRETINPYLSCLKSAGLQPLAFEIESQTIARALIKNEATTSPVLLIDLGATRTSFIIFSGHSIRFTSSIPVSSKGFTEIISRNLRVNLAEAEKLKIKYGLGEEKIRLKAKDKKIKRGKGEIFEALVPALVDLVQQIKRHLDYYRTHASHEHLPPSARGVSKISLCGGGANLKGLPELLSLELKLPVEIGNPWINVLPEDQKKTPKLSSEKSLGYTTAIGLALRAIKRE